MAIISTTAALGQSLGVDLTKNAVISWHEGLESVPFAARSVFDVRSYPHKTSEHSGIDFSPIARATGESNPYANDAPTQTDSLNLTQAKFTNSVILSKEIGMYDRYNKAKAFAAMKGLGMSAPNRMEMDLQYMISTYGFGTAYTDIDGNSISTKCSDGLATFSASHTVNGSTATYSNTLSTAFGQVGLETAEDRVMNFIDHQGNSFSAHVIYDTIITTPASAVRSLVQQHIRSPQTPENANNSVNTRIGSYNHIVFQFCNTTVNATTGNVTHDSTKNNYWFLYASDLKHNLICEVSQEPKLYPPQTIQNTRDTLFQTDCHYAYGVLNPQALIGSNAS